MSFIAVYGFLAPAVIVAAAWGYVLWDRRESRRRRDEHPYAATR